jgi:hypothetical protein
MKAGRRKNVYKTNKRIIKEVNKMMDELDRVAVELIKEAVDKEITYDKEDIKGAAEQFTDMPIDDFAVNILLSKLNDFQKRANEYRKEKQEDNAE